MKRQRLTAWLSVVGLAVAVGCGPHISDTGYAGTWSHRGLSGESTLAIAKRGDAYLFRWGRTSDDGRLQVRCDWDGACEELYDGEMVGTYQFRTWVEEESGRLRVECRGRVYDAERRARLVRTHWYFSKSRVSWKSSRFSQTTLTTAQVPMPF